MNSSKLDHVLYVLKRLTKNGVLVQSMRVDNICWAFNKKKSYL